MTQRGGVREKEGVDMEARSEAPGFKCDKLSSSMLLRRSRLQVWLIRLCSCILLWTCLIQLVAVGELWHPRLPKYWHTRLGFGDSSAPQLTRITSFSLPSPHAAVSSPPPLPPIRAYKSKGFLKVSCNGGLNQMRSAICDMVTVARFLNLTLIVPDLDKTSFWADPSNFGDIFDTRHFIDSLRDEVHIVRRLPKRLHYKTVDKWLVMPPVSWSSEKYYLQQILPLFTKYKVIHFNKTDARLANNGLPNELQRLRCRVNYHAIKFTAQIETLGNKLIRLLREKGSFVALHLRYEMDMLAFSGCTHGCTVEEADELKRMRYAYPWWREKEIVSEERRLHGLCPLTPEETALVLQALGFKNDTQIYIASGEIYGSERRLAALQAAFPRIVRKDSLLDPMELLQFRNHTSQMAALDYMVSITSDIFIPTYDGNMAKVVEGHRRYLGFGKTILLDRKRLVELIDLHQNKTLSWDQFSNAVREAHKNRTGKPAYRRVIADKPKEEDYFYANPHECLCKPAECMTPKNLSAIL